MTLIIHLADFDDPVLNYLEEHLAEMAPHSPLESQHALALAALRQLTVQLWVGWMEQQTAGTCTLVELTPGHEELKSMRTDPGPAGKESLRSCYALRWPPQESAK